MARRSVALGVVGAFVLLGIGLWFFRPPSIPLVDDDSTNDERLHRIGQAYENASNRLGRPPKSMEEIRPAFDELGFPIGNLTSPVDHEPFVIIWDVDVSVAPTNAVLAYQRSCVGGQRLVLAVGGVKVVKIGEEADLLFPPGHPLP